MSLAAKGRAPAGAYRGKVVWITGASQARLATVLVVVLCKNGSTGLRRPTSLLGA